MVHVTHVTSREVILVVLLDDWVEKGREGII